MKESDVRKRLLELDRKNLQTETADRQLARNVLERDRRRVWILAALAILFWLIAAAGVFWVVSAAVFHLYPKHQQLMRDSAMGAIPVERVIELQSLHFRAVEICTLVVAAAFVAATLAVACTILLVLVSRQGTLRQINLNLAEIFDLLKQQQSG